MSHPLSMVPPPPPSAHPDDEYIVTARRLAPYVLRALMQAHLEHRRCTLDDLCELYPVRRADLRHTMTALHHNDLVDAIRGRLTLRGLAAAVALAAECEVPIRDAIRGISPARKPSRPALEARRPRLAKAG